LSSRTLECLTYNLQNRPRFLIITAALTLASLNREAIRAKYAFSLWLSLIALPININSSLSLVTMIIYQRQQGSQTLSPQLAKTLEERVWAIR
jgi:hypothetical protein